MKMMKIRRRKTAMKRFLKRKMMMMRSNTLTWRNSTTKIFLSMIKELKTQTTSMNLNFSILDNLLMIGWMMKEMEPDSCLTLISSLTD